MNVQFGIESFEHLKICPEVRVSNLAVEQSTILEKSEELCEKTKEAITRIVISKRTISHLNSNICSLQAISVRIKCMQDFVKGTIQIDPNDLPKYLKDLPGVLLNKKESITHDLEKLNLLHKLKLEENQKLKERLEQGKIKSKANEVLLKLKQTRILLHGIKERIVEAATPKKCVSKCGKFEIIMPDILGLAKEKIIVLKGINQSLDIIGIELDKKFENSNDIHVAKFSTEISEIKNDICKLKVQCKAAVANNEIINEMLEKDLKAVIKS
ncbi:MAG: hypothetical protein H0W88_03955 [Parachlamydiaceae bacterium]|nr:hypothetical protein [Parachlamydiaceae bacterium]